MESHKIPLVAVNDDGIRPAGKQDECFYCHQKIGQPHKADCVVITKRVKIKYTIELEVDVPYSWEAHEIEFQRNESSWCASNLIDELKDYEEKHGCLCGITTCEFVEVIDNKPTRKLR